jgi:hypothetical protein
MFFHIEQRSAWIRTATHTVVYDRDPDYSRFAGDSTGEVKRMLRIWLAEYRCGRPYLISYLGAQSLCSVQPSFRQLRRLFRLTSRAARQSGMQPGQLRRRLAGLLRRYME